MAPSPGCCCCRYWLLLCLGACCSVLEPRAADWLVDCALPPALNRHQRRALLRARVLDDGPREGPTWDPLAAFGTLPQPVFRRRCRVLFEAQRRDWKPMRGRSGTCCRTSTPCTSARCHRIHGPMPRHHWPCTTGPIAAYWGCCTAGSTQGKNWCRTAGPTCASACASLLQPPTATAPCATGSRIGLATTLLSARVEETA